MFITHEMRLLASQAIERRPVNSMFPDAAVAVHEGKCPTCGGKHEFLEGDDLQEFLISGLCSNCQKEFFS